VTITGFKPTEVIYRTGCKVLSTEYFNNKDYSDGEIEFLFNTYPYLSDKNFMLILDKYKCGSVLVRKEAIHYAASKGWRYPLDKLKKVFENRVYEIYLVDQK
jgi:hypothetical protein